MKYFVRSQLNVAQKYSWNFRGTLKTVCLLLWCSLLFGCASQSVVGQKSTLFEQIGGASTVEKIVDNFIDEISFNKTIYTYFQETNIERFREKLKEQICAYTDGPCNYNGDSMEKVHEGMKISEAHFNLTVELLIKAMERANVPYSKQNLILKRLAPMRKEIIYL